MSGLKWAKLAIGKLIFKANSDKARVGYWVANCRASIAIIVRI
jgi:hypothetical protein